MKQSERVTEATHWALEQLTSMSKNDIDTMLEQREIGPVGWAMIESGAIAYLMEQSANRWHNSIVVHAVHSAVLDQKDHAADTDVRYALMAKTKLDAPFFPMKDAISIMSIPSEVELWAA